MGLLVGCLVVAAVLVWYIDSLVFCCLCVVLPGCYRLLAGCWWVCGTAWLFCVCMLGFGIYCGCLLLGLYLLVGVALHCSLVFDLLV